MIDFKQAGRLLRTDWENPSELARELYSLVTSSGKRTVDAPVDISVPAGKTGLRLTRNTTTTPGPSQSIAVARQAAGPATPQRQSETSKAPDHPPTDVRFRPHQANSQPDLPRPPDASRDTSPSIGEASHFDAGVADQVPRRQVSALSLSPKNPSVQVQNGPSEANIRNLSAPSSPKFAQPYSAPLFETFGEVKFSGSDPVQFDRPPLVFNPATDEYEPIRVDRSFSEVPGETRTFFYWGEVVIGTGDTYQVQLYDYPGSDPGDQVTVTIWKIHPSATLPPMTPLFPVHLADDGNYYAQPPVWLGSFPNG